jgi:hypothetical protein
MASCRGYQAYFIRCVALPAGCEPAPFTCKAVLYDSGRVWWELRRPLLAFFEGLKTRSLQLNKELKRWHASLAAIFLRLATAYCSHVLDSWRASDAKGQEASHEHARQEYMVTSFGQVVFLLWLSCARRATQERQKAKALLLALLHSCLNPEQADIGGVLSHAVADSLQHCAEGASNGICSHMQTVTSMMPPVLGDGHEAVQMLVSVAIPLLQQMLHLVVGCNAAAAALTAVLEALAERLDQSIPLREFKDPLKEDLLQGRSRKLRIDEDFKAVVTDQVRFGRRVLTGAEVVATTSVDEKQVRLWTQAKMLSYQAACYREHSEATGVFGIAEDASRISCPGEETVVYNLWCCQLDKGCFPPVQVPFKRESELLSKFQGSLDVELPCIPKLSCACGLQVESGTAGRNPQPNLAPPFSRSVFWDKNTCFEKLQKLHRNFCNCLQCYIVANIATQSLQSGMGLVSKRSFLAGLVLDLNLLGAIVLPLLVHVPSSCQN